MLLQRVILAEPRGFCAGVDRAIEILDRTLEQLDTPVYCRREIVHNRHVVESFERKGVIFVDELHEVPEGATTVFSAHGIAPSVKEEAKTRHLQALDATCPLVTKVHHEISRFARHDSTILYIGHRNHDEAIGVMGEAPDKVILIENADQARTVHVPDESNVACLTQTTLSIDDTQHILSILKERFPSLMTPDKSDVCYATQNRQEAVKAVADKVDLVLVLGSTTSSNSKRLVEVARTRDTTAMLIGSVDDIDPQWIDDNEAIGITAGASTPEILVQEVVEYFKKQGVREISTLNVAQEDITFSLPKELQDAPEDLATTPRVPA